MIELYYIEDDRNIALSVKEYLEQKDFRVTVCETLAKAKLLIETHVPSCVLLDWNMPDGHGDGLCRWVRSRWKELPVIFLTVRGDSPDIVAGFHSGADPAADKLYRSWYFFGRSAAHSDPSVYAGNFRLCGTGILSGMAECAEDQSGRGA